MATDTLNAVSGIVLAALVAKVFWLNASRAWIFDTAVAFVAESTDVSVQEPLTET